MPSRLLPWIIGLLTLCTLIILVLLFQQGGLLRASLTNVGDTSSPATRDDGTTNETAADTPTLEQYCNDAKAAHIAHCGEVPPDQDFLCRTEQADQAYQECLANTTPEELTAATDAEVSGEGETTIDTIDDTY